MTEPSYFKIIEDLTTQCIWVPKPICLTLSQDQYIALLMGYHPNWDMRYGLIYKFEDGYFYSYRSGFVVGKYRFEKKGDGYVCTELYDNPDKLDCYVIFEIVKEACFVNKMAFDWNDFVEMNEKTQRLVRERSGCS